VQNAIGGTFIESPRAVCIATEADINALALIAGGLNPAKEALVGNLAACNNAFNGRKNIQRTQTNNRRLWVYLSNNAIIAMA